MTQPATIDNADAVSAIILLLRDYFDGLYFSDTERLKRVFHPQGSVRHRHRRHAADLAHG